MEDIFENIYDADSFEELFDILDNMEESEKVNKARSILSHTYCHIDDNEEEEYLHEIKEEIIEILKGE